MLTCINSSCFRKYSLTIYTKLFLSHYVPCRFFFASLNHKSIIIFLRFTPRKKFHDEYRYY